MRHPSRRPARGFTLVELLVVMAIISILMVFILAAASQGAQEARRQATISLIAKLETGLADRIQAILSQRIDPINSHYVMGAVYQNMVNPFNGNVELHPLGGTFDASGIYSSTAAQQATAGRAQTIALFDLYRAELPDAFFVQSAAPSATSYPINFAQQPYPGLAAPYSYLLPLGVGGQPSTGIYGASYTAAAGLYKNLGNVPGSPVPYQRKGVDGADNNGNGLIDEYGEGSTSTSTASLSAHLHNTARAEMLYALLVESDSPYFSTMNRDDFTDTEVGDTDGDGLPEFLDAWGNPIYFYRWPIFYHSDVQKGVDPLTVVGGTVAGTGPYLSVTQTREVDPLDPNQFTLSPAWWSGAVNQGPGAGYWPSAPLGPAGESLSSLAVGFQGFFHQLVEPLSSGGTPNPAQYWDRGSTYLQRRAFFSRPLIISAGPDGLLGLPVLTDAIIHAQTADTASRYIQLEGQAAPFNLNNRLNYNVFGGPLAIQPDVNDSTVPDLYQLQGQDDISNHTTQASGGSTQ